MAKATEDDTVLARVYQLIKQGWPDSKSKLEKALHPYFVKRFEFTIQSGCILHGSQVVIPSSLRKAVMSEFHDAHTGIVKMKSIARMYVWWPSLNQEIEDCARKCHHCQRFK